MIDQLHTILENDRVILRPLELAHEAELQALAKDKDLWVYGLADLSRKGEMNNYISKAMQAREEGTCAVWTIIDKRTNMVAGCTRLAEISWKDERGQIGWTWIARKYQGSGLNKSMKFLILQFGFESLKLNRIELKADERNVRSRRAIQGIGATEEGILRQHMKIHDGYLRNTVFYSILKSEWEEIKKKRFDLQFLNQGA